MKIFCWNVNSIKARLPVFEQFVREQSPDVILLQETKCINDQFPLSYVEDLGYNCYLHGQKTYNGVAILSKVPVEDVVTGILEGDEQARYISGFVPYGGQMIMVASVYVPNGSDPKSDKFQHKMRFFAALEDKFKEFLLSSEKCIVAGDYNVAPEDIDVYDPKYLDGKIGFHIDERRCFRRLLDVGMVDSYRLFNENQQAFSWWDYRTRGFETGKGMRIDHILVTPNLINDVKAAGIEPHYRGLERPSDHTPIYVELK